MKCVARSKACRHTSGLAYLVTPEAHANIVAVSINTMVVGLNCQFSLVLYMLSFIYYKYCTKYTHIKRQKVKTDNIDIGIISSTPEPHVL